MNCDCKWLVCRCGTGDQKPDFNGYPKPAQDDLNRAAEQHANPAGLINLTTPVRGIMDRCAESFKSGADWRLKQVLEKLRSEGRKKARGDGPESLEAAYQHKAACKHVADWLEKELRNK
jgi:hypothetical protein